MTKYEELLIEASKLGILIVENELDSGGGYYCDSVILIDRRLSEDMKYCVLAEELGHHFTTYGDITMQNNILNRKQELIARRWAYNHTVTLVGIIEAFEYGTKTCAEMAEFLGVTEDFLLDSISYYRDKYGLGYQFEQYYIKFEPSLGIYKNFI